MKIESNIDDVINSLEKSIEKAIKAAEKELQLTALEIERDAKLNAPVDTGMLRASITSTGSGSEYEIGTNIEYAPFVEFGTKYMAAQPFLFPAFEKGVRDLQKNIKKAVISALR